MSTRIFKGRRTVYVSPGFVVYIRWVQIIQDGISSLGNMHRVSFYYLILGIHSCGVSSISSPSNSVFSMLSARTVSHMFSYRYLLDITSQTYPPHYTQQPYPSPSLLPSPSNPTVLPSSPPTTSSSLFSYPNTLLSFIPSPSEGKGESNPINCLCNITGVAIVEYSFHEQ